MSGGGEIVEIGTKFRGQGRGKGDGFAGAGLGKGNFGGVKEIAAGVREMHATNEEFGGGTVKGVSYNGMAQGGEMDANLMGAAGV